MKITAKFHRVATFVWLLTMAACTNPNSSIDSAAVESSTAKGTWEISYFWDQDKDETHHFTGFQFEFGTDGSVSASNGSVTKSGTWSVHDSSDDSHVEFDLHFAGSSDQFDDISDDWHVVEQSNRLIRLEDVSGGSSLTEYLDFKKI